MALNLHEGELLGQELEFVDQFLELISRMQTHSGIESLHSNRLEALENRLRALRGRMAPTSRETFDALRRIGLELLDIVQLESELEQDPYAHSLESIASILATIRLSMPGG